MSFFTRSTAVVIFCLLIANALYSQRAQREQYIQQFSGIAVRQMSLYKIPASIILAQACLESGDGTSRLAKEANNHFGIKCHDWKGAYILHDDDAKNECFRKYDNPEESFKDHSLFLRDRQRYSQLFSLDPKDYRGWAHGLKQAGYATNPNYAALLIKIIEDYELYRYDNINPDTIGKDSNLSTEESKVSDPLISGYNFTLERANSTINGVSFIIATSQDTYESLALEYGLFTKELLRFNDLEAEVAISDGTIVYLSKKRREGERSLTVHSVKPGETMYEISQIYGIRLKNLLKINSKNRDYIPVTGELIKLRR